MSSKASIGVQLYSAGRGIRPSLFGREFSRKLGFTSATETMFISSPHSDCFTTFAAEGFTTSTKCPIVSGSHLRLILIDRTDHTIPIEIGEIECSVNPFHDIGNIL
ncbi:MAG: hypothetical protein NT027_17480 [Proteobacteria bacterium]|nr:hypothetical protein [Pseudomonadota bacterium]